MIFCESISKLYESFKRFNKNNRDFGKLALEKTGAIERIINKGGDAASRCIEIASGAELTEEEKKIRLEGQFFDLGGLALAHLFKKETHIVEDFEVPRDWNVIIAIDPHPSKKHVALALAINPYNKQMYVVSTIAEKLVASDFAMKVHEWTKKWKVAEYICDSLGSADLTGGEGFKSFIQVLNDYGIRVRPTSFEDKKDEVWIERIRTALAVPQQANNFGETKPRLQVFKSCDTIIRDIQNVAWVKNKTAEMNRDRLEISNKDYLACLKYALSVAARYIDERVINARPIKMGAKQGVSLRDRYMKGSR